MYIDRIALRDFRTFRRTEIELVWPGREPSGHLPQPALPNVNLLLGNNGSGKTSLLKAIALAALGPAAGDSGIFPYRLIRREPEPVARRPEEAVIEARFVAHEQDRLTAGTRLAAETRIIRRGDLEVLRWSGDEAPWQPIFSAESDAFFFVGYGATRRVEKRERVDSAARSSSAFARAQRVQSLFEESYSLIPLSAWLPGFRNRGRHQQVVNLIDRLLGKGHFRFNGELEEGEYLFEHKGLKVPFPALSDGYRAFLGWIGDLLYHICLTCPSGKKLVENRGIVMVDEIDLHLHPQWQMTVLPTLATALPNIQFIVTSHSPLVVGSLQWMNLVSMASDRHQASRLKRIEWAVHGLDADQVLLTDFFGLKSTRAASRERELKTLTLKAREGDAEAAMRLLELLGRGAESSH